MKDETSGCFILSFKGGLSTSQSVLNAKFIVSELEAFALPLLSEKDGISKIWFDLRHCTGNSDFITASSSELERHGGGATEGGNSEAPSFRIN